MPTRQRILIIEDNFDNLSIFSTILEFTGFEVLSATDGPAGLVMARREKPDLILMDVGLPGIDGWEATRTLKADPETADIPILVLTAHALERDRLQAFAEGADGFIPKPADPMAVVNAIRSKLADPGLRVGMPAVPGPPLGE